MIAPAYRSGITRAAFWATDDIPSLTVGTSLFAMAGRAAGTARALTRAVRRGVPTTFSRQPPRPGSRAVHAIFVAHPGVSTRLLLEAPGNNEHE